MDQTTTINRIKFTSEIIKKISQNKNVMRCGGKSVRYTKDFKLKALRQYHEDGLSAVGIFQDAGFDLNLIGKRTPNRLMNQWATVLKLKDESKPEKKVLAMIKRIKSRREVNALKAKITHLQATNDFLAKFRARKRK